MGYTAHTHRTATVFAVSFAALTGAMMGVFAGAAGMVLDVVRLLAIPGSVILHPLTLKTTPQRTNKQPLLC